MNYTEFIAFMKSNNLTGVQVSKAIGMSTANYYQQIKPGKPLPHWARALMVGTRLAELNKPHQSTGVSDISDSTEGSGTKNIAYPCGCRLNGKLFTRADSCKLDRKAH
ncbi:MAG TPA: hypothetical protein VEA37_03390 [Flavobacterium sp.]|nr:hypothetical protein [Flavobacterium sp.]